jgi:hypothetical protein
LFLLRQGRDILIVQVYVDDIVFGGSSNSPVARFADDMSREFEMSKMGELQFFLGLQIKQSKEGTFVHQAKYTKDIVSVRKVVPTLTSKSAEIYLSMAGAKQLVTRGLSWFRPVPYAQQWCARGTIFALHSSACRGGLQARRERRSGLQVLKVFDWGKCQYRGEGSERASVFATVVLMRPLDCSSFYRPRRRQFTGVPHCSSYV